MEVLTMLSLKALSVKQFEALTGVHFTTNMSGKMEGMQSLSTSCLVNPLCMSRANDPNTICSHCYAIAQLERYTNNQPCFERNTNILTTEVFEVDTMPILNCLYFRFEAFGDLVNATQVINYFNLCKKNPLVKFALWTKNPWIIDEAIVAGNEKPENLNIVYSSCILNERVNDAIVNKWSFIDKIFTVYDKSHPEIDINCGNSKCIECRKCYEKNDIKYINELLK